MVEQLSVDQLPHRHAADTLTWWIYQQQCAQWDMLLGMTATNSNSNSSSNSSSSSSSRSFSCEPA